MRYKDEVKGSAELNWLNDLLESQPIEAITINRKTAELLLNYADKALATQENEQAGDCIQSVKSLQPHGLQIPEHSVRTIDIYGVPLDMIEVNMLVDLVQEQLERTELDENYGKQYVFDLMSLNHKLQIEHMKRR